MSKSKKEPEAPEVSIVRIEELYDTRLINNSVYESLPRLLKDGCNLFSSSSRERDIFLTASITLMGGCMPNYYIYYDDRKNYCNIYTMIVAPPASGKGVVIHAYTYLDEIEKQLMLRYQSELKEHSDSLKAEKNNKEIEAPIVAKARPRRKKIVIPANSSSSAFMNSLNDSEGSGIIFETEADTLAQTLNQDWGNYSEVLRKAFHHEPITFSRKADNVEIEIKKPRLSVLITGTPNQVNEMKLNNPANGLASRFSIYLFDKIPTFKDLGQTKSRHIEHTMLELSKEFEFIYQQLAAKEEEVEFILSKDQWKFISKFYQKKLDQITRNSNTYSSAFVTRNALVAVRIAGILSLLGNAEKNILIDDKIYCSWHVLRTSLSLAETYLEHSLVIFELSNLNQKDEILHQYMDFYKLLPTGEFTRKEILPLCDIVKFSERTVDRRLEKLRKSGLLKSMKSGVYQKK